MRSRGRVTLAETAGNATLPMKPTDAMLGLSTVVADASKATVHVAGDLDLSTTDGLSAVLEEHLAAGRRYLRVDLGSCTFLDSTALATLVDVHERVLNSRGTLVLMGVGARPERLLRITKLDKVLLVGGPRSV
jgi:anti-anti-sigma factor